MILSTLLFIYTQELELFFKSVDGDCKYIDEFTVGVPPYDHSMPSQVLTEEGMNSEVSVTIQFSEMCSNTPPTQDHTCSETCSYEQMGEF